MPHLPISRLGAPPRTGQRARRIDRLMAAGVGMLLAAGGCTGEISDAVHPISGSGGAGTVVSPPRGPGEIPGVGGASGASGSGGSPVDGAATTDGAADGGGSGGAGGMTGATEPAHGLAIADVAIYQAAKVNLSKMRLPIPSLDTPLVANRPAFIRVFVTPDAGWQPRPVVARLTWAAGTVMKEVTATITATSTDADVASTLNFTLTAAEMPATIDWSVALFERPGQTGTGSTTGAKLPADGTAAKVTNVFPGPLLKIMFVPIRYNGDGSGRLPDTTPEQIKFLSDAMFATYPVSKIETTIREPITAAYKIDPLGAGWDRIVNDVCIQRQYDRPARNIYYYGLLAPGASLRTYCAQGCVEGVAPLTQSPSDDSLRCSMGLGFTGSGTGVFLQEVAHSMGRPHAPCGNPQGVDRMFPYQGGKIGTWGYDLLRQRLINPATTADFMSYCQPVWISDYTFSRLLTWMRAVESMTTMAFAPGPDSVPELASARGDRIASPAALSVPRFAPARWRVATVEADGSIIWGDVVDFGALSGGVSQTITLREGSGLDRTVSGLYFPHSTTTGGMLLLPESAPARPRALQLGGAVPFRTVRFE